MGESQRMHSVRILICIYVLLHHSVLHWVSSEFFIRCCASIMPACGHRYVIFNTGVCLIYTNLLSCGEHLIFAIYLSLVGWTACLYRAKNDNSFQAQTSSRLWSARTSKIYNNRHLLGITFRINDFKHETVYTWSFTDESSLNGDKVCEDNDHPPQINLDFSQFRQIDQRSDA